MSRPQADADGYTTGRVGAPDGLGIHYRDYGPRAAAGLPLLCLSGVTRNAADFHDFALHFAPRRRVIAMDYRGRGQSDYDPDWRSYKPPVMLHDVAALLTALDLNRVVVIGTSLGGLMGLALNVFRPLCVAGLVMNDIGPALEDSGFHRIRAYLSKDRVQPDWPTAIAHVRETFPPLGLSDEKWERLARATFKDGADGRLHFNWDVKLVNTMKPLDEAARAQLWNLFRALGQKPALCIRGGVSDLLPAEGLMRMKAEKPDLMTLTVPDVGHVPDLARPDCLAAVEALLEKTG